MNIKFDKMSFNKLLTVTMLLKRELDQILIINKNGERVYRYVIILTSEEIAEFQNSFVDRVKMFELRKEYEFDGVSGFYGRLNDVYILTEELRHDVESGIINIPKILIEEQKRMEMFKHLPGFNGQYKIN